MKKPSVKPPKLPGMRVVLIDEEGQYGILCLAPKQIQEFVKIPMTGTKTAWFKFRSSTKVAHYFVFDSIREAELKLLPEKTITPI